MVEVQTSIQLNIKEIYDILCPKCKKKLRKLVKDKVAERLTDKILHSK